MGIDRKTKESWVHQIVSALGDTLKPLGFKNAGKLKYKRRVNDCECRYLISIRYPRFADDRHQLYIAPCIHVFFSEFEEAHAKVTGKPLRKGFPTLGSSLGLYKGGNYEEWPVDDQQSALALVPSLATDIKSIAKPFWDSLSTRAKILESIEKNEKWSQRLASWKYRHVILLYLERGIDDAIRFVTENQKKFRDIDKDTIKERLLTLGN